MHGIISFFEKPSSNFRRNFVLEDWWLLFPPLSGCFFVQPIKEGKLGPAKREGETVRQQGLEWEIEIERERVGEREVERERSCKDWALLTDWTKSFSQSPKFSLILDLKVIFQIFCTGGANLNCQINLQQSTAQNVSIKTFCCFKFDKYHKDNIWSISIYTCGNVIFCFLLAVRKQL